MKYLFISIKILIVVLFFTVFLSNAANAQSPNIFFSTPPKQVEEGDRLTIDVRVQSSQKSINAIYGSVMFPEALVRVASVSKETSIINLWTREPMVQRGRILFEGIVLNPGFQGSSGLVFRITLEAKKAGIVQLSFSEGAVLANDGLGSNVLTSLGSTNFKIVPGQVFPSTIAEGGTTTTEAQRLAALPVIIEYSPATDANNNIYVKGKGEPSALTKIIFKDISVKSVGEKLIGLLQTKKKKLDEILVRNDALGEFEYISSKNLVAGVYNATPFLVDNNTNTEKPGLGVQLLVSDSKIVKALVVVINVLGLLIPIVGLGVVIYFIPWYSWRRMRLMKKKMGLEEEKIELSGHQLERQDKVLDKTVENMVSPDKPAAL